MDVVVYALLKKYINDTLVGMGALKGEPAQIQSITPITGGNRATYLWKDENGETHTDTMDVMDGVKGEKGDKGDKGDKGTTGERGVDGEPGPAGRTATVQVGTVSSGASPSVENVGTNSDAVFNFILPKGDKGDKGEDGEDGQDGKSFDIKGQYPTYAALIAAHPTGEAGEAYFVGTDNNPDLYIWLTDDQIWYNNGKIAGVKGDKGDTGEDGFSPIASVSKSGTTTTVIIRDKTGQTTAQIHDGEKGEPGEGEPMFNGTQAQWDGLTLEEKLEYLTGLVVINDDYDDSEYVKREELGTAAAKDSTDRVSPNNRGLVESQSVYSAINSALSSIYEPRGDIACADLTSELLIPANVGSVYETSDNGTTTALFLQGAGVPIVKGDNVGIINAGEGRILFNKMANAFDLTSYQKKDLTQAVEGASTVEGALGTLSTNKAAKSEMSITPGTDADADKTTIQLKTGTSATVLTQHQNISGKADKVTGATAGDIATLDANGNLVDSGVVASSVIHRVNPSTAVDCNDLTDRFTEYRVGDGDANRPTTGSEAYIIRTFKTGADSTVYSQIAYQIAGTAIYIRRRFSDGVWSSWEKLVTESDTPKIVSYDINVTADGNGNAAAGVITDRGIPINFKPASGRNYPCIPFVDWGGTIYIRPLSTTWGATDYGTASGINIQGTLYCIKV